MSKYKEIFKLKEMLDEAKIEYEFNNRSFKNPYNADVIYEFYQICCPNGGEEERYVSVIEGYRNIWQ